MLDNGSVHFGKNPGICSCGDHANLLLAVVLLYTATTQGMYHQFPKGLHANLHTKL